MKHLLFIGIVGMLFLSCNKHIAKLPKNEDQKFLDKELKLSFFKSCLRYGNNNSKSVLQVLKYDISLQMDFPLGIEGYGLADSLGRLIGDRIREDSLYQYNRYLGNNPDFKDLYGSRVLFFCLDFYESDELDSIIQERALWYKPSK